MKNRKQVIFLVLKIIFSIVLVGAAYYAHQKMLEINAFLDAMRPLDDTNEDLNASQKNDRSK